MEAPSEGPSDCRWGSLDPQMPDVPDPLGKPTRLGVVLDVTDDGGREARIVASYEKKTLTLFEGDHHAETA